MGEMEMGKGSALSGVRFDSVRIREFGVLILCLQWALRDIMIACF